MAYIGIDFDGTLAEHRFPEIGMEVPYAVETCAALSDAGHKLILWTMRSGETLDQAVAWCMAKGLKLYAVNGNPDQADWTSSPKAYCNLYIDDAALGCPLIYPETGRAYVDWTQVRDHLRYGGWL